MINRELLQEEKRKQRAGREKARKKKFYVAFLFFLPLIFACAYWAYLDWEFNVHVEQHMDIAASSSSLDLAKSEMQIVVSEMEERGMTEGSTCIFYPSPKKDVSIWYTSMKGCLAALSRVDPEDQTATSNVLMKLDESLREDGDSGGGIKVPAGISRFPHNKLHIGIMFSSIVLACYGIYSLKDEIR